MCLEGEKLSSRGLLLPVVQGELTEEMLVWFAIISPLTRCAEGR